MSLSDHSPSFSETREFWEDRVKRSFEDDKENSAPIDCFEMACIVHDDLVTDADSRQSVNPISSSPPITSRYILGDTSPPGSSIVLPPSVDVLPAVNLGSLPSRLNSKNWQERLSGYHEIANGDMEFSDEIDLKRFWGETSPQVQEAALNSLRVLCKKFPGDTSRVALWSSAVLGVTEKYFCSGNGKIKNLANLWILDLVEIWGLSVIDDLIEKITIGFKKDSKISLRVLGGLMTMVANVFTEFENCLISGIEQLAISAILSIDSILKDAGYSILSQMAVNPDELVKLSDTQKKELSIRIEKRKSFFVKKRNLPEIVNKVPKNSSRRLSIDEVSVDVVLKQLPKDWLSKVTLSEKWQERKDGISLFRRLLSSTSPSCQILNNSPLNLTDVVSLLIRLFKNEATLPVVSEALCLVVDLYNFSAFSISQVRSLLAVILPRCRDKALSKPLTVCLSSLFKFEAVLDEKLIMSMLPLGLEKGSPAKAVIIGVLKERVEGIGDTLALCRVLGEWLGEDGREGIVELVRALLKTQSNSSELECTILEKSDRWGEARKKAIVAELGIKIVVPYKREDARISQKRSQSVGRVSSFSLKENLRKSIGSLSARCESILKFDWRDLTIFYNRQVPKWLGDSAAVRSAWRGLIGPRNSNSLNWQQARDDVICLMFDEGVHWEKRVNVLECIKEGICQETIFNNSTIFLLFRYCIDIIQKSHNNPGILRGVVGVLEICFECIKGSNILEIEWYPLIFCLVGKLGIHEIAQLIEKWLLNEEIISPDNLERILTRAASQKKNPKEISNLLILIQDKSSKSTESIERRYIRAPISPKKKIASPSPLRRQLRPPQSIGLFTDTATLHPKISRIKKPSTPSYLNIHSPKSIDNHYVIPVSNVPPDVVSVPVVVPAVVSSSPPFSRNQQTPRKPLTSSPNLTTTLPLAVVNLLEICAEGSESIFEAFNDLADFTENDLQTASRNAGAVVAAVAEGVKVCSQNAQKYENWGPLVRCVREISRSRPLWFALPVGVLKSFLAQLLNLVGFRTFRENCPEFWAELNLSVVHALANSDRLSAYSALLELGADDSPLLPLVLKCADKLNRTLTGFLGEGVGEERNLYLLLSSIKNQVDKHGPSSVALASIQAVCQIVGTAEVGEFVGLHVTKNRLWWKQTLKEFENRTSSIQI